MRALLAAAVLATFVTATPASADRKKKDDPPAASTDAKPKRVPGPKDAAATAILDKLAAAPDRAARERAIAELNKLAPEAIEAIGEWVQRPHQAAAEVRRDVLVAIDADVPDEHGRFKPRDRDEARKEDKSDWLAALLAVDGNPPGLGEVIADVAAIRAVALVKDIRGAQQVFDVAFADETMIYRDECGRYLRKAEPYSIPALTRESLGRRRDRRRYATWQLERIDRQDPLKALGAATGNEALQIQILDTFRETRHREAVHAVWAYVDHDNPRVRAAARKAWMAYVTGPPPPPAPRKKLQLPGGKLTKKPKPLWLTYRELADNDLRKSANELLHEDYPIAEQSLDDRDREIRIAPIDLEEVTQRLFAYYDGERQKRDAAQWAAAKTKADAGELATAATMLDQLIAMNPERTERAAMAAVYVAYGKQLEQANKWGEASAAFSKAHGLDPKPTTLAAVHFTLGKSLEAAGKDGGPDFRRAIALDPDYAPAKTAAAAAAPASSKPAWMLYAALGAGGLAMLLFGAAMLTRRRA